MDNRFEGSQLQVEVSQRVVEMYRTLFLKLKDEDWVELDDKIIDFLEKMHYKYNKDTE